MNYNNTCVTEYFFFITVLISMVLRIEQYPHNNMLYIMYYARVGNYKFETWAVWGRKQENNVSVSMDEQF